MDMSQNNPIRLFVTHAWETSDEYLRIFEYLESARNFFYKNLSAPDKAPAGGKEADREELRKQIAQAECVIALPGLYRQHSELLLFELNFAKASDKPVILMRPFGANAVLPTAITSLSDQTVEWDGRALVDAVKKQARHDPQDVERGSRAPRRAHRAHVLPHDPPAGAGAAPADAAQRERARGAAVRRRGLVASRA